MTAVVGAPESLSVRPGRPENEQGSGSGSRLLRFALANVRRRPERFVLSTLGIALAIMAVIVVRTVAQGYSSTGSASLAEVLRGDQLWVVPAAGVTYDPQLQALLPDGSAPPVAVPRGWTAHTQVAGSWASPSGAVALYGSDGVATGTAELGTAAAALLGVSDGATLDIGGTPVTVAVDGSGRIVVTDLATASAVVGDDGWWTATPAADEANRTDLGAELGEVTGLPSTSDPARTPDASGAGLVYDTAGGSSLATFGQKFSALFAGQVTGSVLGVVSTVGLVLGFVIAVSSFLAAVQERRREFGIMASIGLADEVLYFFLVESALVFVAAYLAGALAAGAAVALVVPATTTLAGWLQASGTVAAYLPAMAIVGALVPVHRLLQQRPVDLLQAT